MIFQKLTAREKEIFF